MSAPAGWHLQPDGQERYWDGTRWTDEFRAPLPSDPTAPPPDPEWASGVEETQALDVESTRAIPAPPQQPYQPDQPAAGAAPPAAPGAPTYPQADAAQQQYQAQQYPQYQQQQYQQPGYQQQYPQAGYQQQYPQPGYPQTGYGAPGGQTWAPPPRQGGGLAKGCLIAAVVGLLVVGAIIAAIFVLANRAVDSVSRNFPSGFPTSLPTGLPSDGTGQALTVAVGDGFDLPRASVQPGWSLAAGDGGVPVVNITGMKAQVSSDQGLPVLFTMSVTGPRGESADTVCTASGGSSGSTVDVSCVPLFADVADATEVTVTPTL